MCPVEDPQLLPGKAWTYAVGPTSSGASGTITVPAGACVCTIRAHSTAGGTIKIGSGATIPIVAGDAFTECPPGDKLKAPSGGLDIVATGTDSFYVSYETAP